MAVQLHFSIPVAFTDSVGCRLQSVIDDGLLLHFLQDRSSYYAAATMSSTELEYSDGSCACGCGAASSSGSATFAGAFIAPMVVFAVMVVFLVYRRQLRHRKAPATGVNDAIDYTLPPALPDFVPPPSYQRSTEGAGEDMKSHALSKSGGAPTYKLPPKYRQPQSGPVRTLPEYEAAPTYATALALRAGQMRGRIPDFSETESSSNDSRENSGYFESIVRRRVPPHFDHEPEYDFAMQRPESSRSGRSSQSSPDFDSISQRSVPEYEDPPELPEDLRPHPVPKYEPLPRFI